MNSAQYPRPEYPRPDRQRGLVEGLDWLNLNGPWQFRFDGDRVGWEQAWFAREQPAWPEQILVPFCWESLAAWGEGNAAGNENYYATRVFRNPLEVTRANHRAAPRYEVGWYRREIRVPAEWAGRRAILTVGAADFFTDAWCNGVHLGHHEGGYDPFEFDLTDTLDADGRGVIVLRVEDPMDNREQPVGKQWEWYTTTSGIWQTVFVEPRGVAHVGDFRITTDIAARTAHFDVEAINAPAGAELAVEVRAPSGAPLGAVFPIEDGRACGTLPLDPFVLWDPFDPQLYRVILRLRHAGGEPDLVRTYFGARQITTAPVDRPDAPAALVLNGRPIYLRGALYQSYFPDGVYTARDVRMIQDDIAYAKSRGFDFLRIHIKIDDPLVLHYADTIGMLLMCDFPNFGEGGDTPLGRRRYEETMRAAIRRDFNHPSIIAWCTFNETWGFGGQVELVKHIGSAPPSVTDAAPGPLQNQSAHEWVQRMWELAKQLDPTRLVEDMSVVHWNHLAYFAHGDTDINSWHFYLHDYAQAREHIEKVVAQTYAGSTFNYVDGFRQGAQPLINSEYGGVGALDGDCDVSWSFKFLTNELRRHASLSAYIYTELHDVEWEYNGFLNYDRTPKEFGYDPLIINQGDVLPVDAPPIQECAPGQLVCVPVSSSHYSRVPRGPVTLHWRLSGVDSLGRTHQDLVRGRVPIAFPQFRVAPAHTVEFALPETPMLSTLWLQAIDDQGEEVATNFVQFLVPAPEDSPREDHADQLVLRAAVDAFHRAAWTEPLPAPDELARLGACAGYRTGYFEWEFPLTALELAGVRRITVLVEASSRGLGNPQTDGQRQPTTCEITLNGVPVHRAVLPGHPHDTRGALSYLRGAKGAYGYLAHATAEGELLARIRAAGDGTLRLRCAVPEDAVPQEGLTIYGPRSGRYPLGPTLLLDHGP